MPDASVISASSRTTGGLLLLTIVAIEWGGLFMLRVIRRRHAATPFQMAFFRAGHAHAGVLVTLSLATQVFVDATGLRGPFEALARSGIPLAAILMPTGFFLSAWGAEVTAPNRLIALIYVGAVSLGAGAASLGVGLLAT